MSWHITYINKNNLTKTEICKHKQSNHSGSLAILIFKWLNYFTSRMRHHWIYSVIWNSVLTFCLTTTLGGLTQFLPYSRQTLDSYYYRFPEFSASVYGYAVEYHEEFQQYMIFCLGSTSFTIPGSFQLFLESILTSTPYLFSFSKRRKWSSWIMSVVTCATIPMSLHVRGIYLFPCGHHELCQVFRYARHSE